jgi:hypothetical protein
MEVFAANLSDEASVMEISAVSSAGEASVMEIFAANSSDEASVMEIFAVNSSEEASVMEKYPWVIQPTKLPSWTHSRFICPTMSPSWKYSLLIQLVELPSWEYSRPIRPIHGYDLYKNAYLQDHFPILAMMHADAISTSLHQWRREVFDLRMHIDKASDLKNASRSEATYAGCMSWTNIRPECVVSFAQVYGLAAI